MSELNDKLLEIKRQKDEYIIPENLKKDVTVFNITGTYNGEHQTTKQFTSITEMNNDPNKQLGDMAIIYNLYNMPQENDEFSSIYFPESITLSQQAQEVYADFENVNTGTRVGWIKIDSYKNHINIVYPDGETDYSTTQILYKTSDGIHYTLNNGPLLVNLGATYKFVESNATWEEPYPNEWQRVFEVVRIEKPTFDGLYKVENVNNVLTYVAAETQLSTIMPEDVNVMKVVMGANNNIVTGVGSMMKEYISENAMNNDIDNINIGEVVRVFAAGEITYYIKDGTPITYQPLDLSTLSTGDTISLKGMKINNEATSNVLLMSGDFKTLTFSDNGQNVLELNFSGGVRTISGNITLNGTDTYTYSSVGLDENSELSSDVVEVINDDNIWNDDTQLTVTKDYVNYNSEIENAILEPVGGYSMIKLVEKDDTLNSLQIPSSINVLYDRESDEVDVELPNTINWSNILQLVKPAIKEKSGTEWHYSDWEDPDTGELIEMGIEISSQYGDSEGGISNVIGLNEDDGKYHFNLSYIYIYNENYQDYDFKLVLRLMNNEGTDIYGNKDIIFNVTAPDDVFYNLFVTGSNISSVSDIGISVKDTNNNDIPYSANYNRKIGGIRIYLTTDKDGTISVTYNGNTETRTLDTTTNLENNIYNQHLTDIQFN